MISSLIESLRTAITQQIMNDPIWAAVALVGQALFGGRFIIQWIASESRKRSHVPTSFWFISVAGSVILLCYSVHIKNPIFVLAFLFNTLIYLRNIQLIFKHVGPISTSVADNPEG